MNSTSPPISGSSSTLDPADAAVLDDPRPVFATALRTGAQVIAALSPDQLAASTPCPAFDVRTLLGHLVGVVRRVAAVGRGEPPMSVPSVVEGVADDGWSDAWRAATHDQERAWRDPGALTRLLSLPFGQFPGAQALRVYTNEVTVHTWDLAVATGQHPQWDSRVIGVAAQAFGALIPPVGRQAEFEARVAGLPPAQRPAAPFVDAWPVAADASPIERLVAYNGRRPSTPAQCA